MQAGLRELQKVRASGSRMKLLWISGMPTRLSLGSLSLVLDDYEEGCWPILHKLVENLSRSTDEPEAERNQSTLRHEV